MITHWAEIYLGIPWVTGGRDPNKGLDCWGLLRHVYRQLYDVDVTEYACAPGTLAPCNLFEWEKAKGDWTEVTEPREGDAVALGRDRISHAGIYVTLPEPAILHIKKGTLSCIDRIDKMRSQGWKRIHYYRHVRSSAH